MAIEDVEAERLQVPAEEMNIIYFLKKNDNDSYFILLNKKFFLVKRGTKFWKVWLTLFLL